MTLDEFRQTLSAALLPPLLRASRAGDLTAERGGRAKRLFRVTAHGIRSVNEPQRVLRRMLDGLEPIGSHA